MVGRGIDQILPYPSDPRIHEPYVQDAREYIALAEAKNGAIPRHVSPNYIWGDALKHLAEFAPELRIINLETSITTSDDYWNKGINYRLNPKNIACLIAAQIDCCALANNHVLDWGYRGLEETTETLRRVGVRFAGAGRNLSEAAAPAVMDVGVRRRVVFFSFASESSGVPLEWAATSSKPGVNLIDESTPESIRHVKRMIEVVKREGDVVVAAVHWGPNWGYAVPETQRRFAHQLVEAGVDLVHGHSSHHPKGIEVYRNRLILYGCGDFLNDYEGIEGYEWFRGDLGLMYFVYLEENGELLSVRMVATQIKRFRVNDASAGDRLWLGGVLDRECAKLGCRVEFSGDLLVLRWR